VEDALIAMRRARASYQAAVQARKLQQESLAAEQAKFEIGTSTSFFVIQYQSLLAQAKSTEIAAQELLRQGARRAQRATGTILDSAPDWTNSALFDLTARVPPGTTYEQFQIMLQNLLADRFQLAVHHETRQHLSYKLVVAKNGPKFKEAGAPAEQDDDAPPRPSGSKPFKFDADGYPVFGPGDSGTKMSASRGRMYEPQMTMDRLAGFLAGNLHATITDATGLGGRYEISLAWVVGSRTAAPPSSGEEASLAETDSGPTLTQALQSQLGLRLVESSKVPIDLLVVDHAEKVPAGN
jgi:uncharacterized protein (TIGR03435 family)